MKKSIFTFFIFIFILSFLSACSTARKGGCGCPGLGEITETQKNQYS